MRGDACSLSFRRGQRRLVDVWLTASLCRVPSRRAGNFHLRGQMKVTKAKALDATPLMRSARYGSPARRATWQACGASNFLRARRRGHRSTSPARIRWTQGQSEARPRLTNCRQKGRRSVQWPAGRGSEACRTREWFCVEPLCFGDFHLGPQMKVTRPPGRDPAMQRSQQRTSTKRTQVQSPREAWRAD